ncbi:hypothetical protein [Ktedonobacter racemifer]|uniref:hypothetical protein n=1 Tax=Ktedonobacter racemifer TaxID=363277 RepID=UPI0002D2EC53|nr:hypothetical protein [Ktedonobacter racemifer]
MRHPLLYTGTGTPTSTTKLPGKLRVVTDYLGRKMVFYQSYPLYTWAKHAPAPND